MKLDINAKFSSYPAAAQKQLQCVRQLIFLVAKENNLNTVTEALKWNEASYQVKGGSTIRMDWKPKDPDVIKVFFHCQTRLVETFKEVYPSEFDYEGNRAVVIPLNCSIQDSPLGHCLQLALTYHSVKHLPLLGA
ncbi:hypothetical protein [Gilvimarinus polysaccharolyticus]|uniref:hypothetical protein n=1 Tax=Gilvimarinus polysaccharolyticus TaxID=863921 RepID=UPI000673598A|nr:hypothetical protein [Gilvimarinus polysaccharolyticus]